MKRTVVEIELQRLLVRTEELLATDGVLAGNALTLRTFRAVRNPCGFYRQPEDGERRRPPAPASPSPPLTS